MSSPRRCGAFISGLLIRQGGTILCGEVVSARRGAVVLKADGVESTVDLAQADSVTPVPT
ncbi:hypothetical protein [Streptomyces sp. NPDC050988]|uniref:hypothetical protein n=1 Tax=Streptomyces sp. NPDC050988 TaxID=3365637 RepID=UPI0037968CCB